MIVYKCIYHLPCTLCVTVNGIPQSSPRIVLSQVTSLCHGESPIDYDRMLPIFFSRVSINFFLKRSYGSCLHLLPRRLVLISFFQERVLEGGSYARRGQSG